MFLLDTNVLSEMRKMKSGRAAPAVAAWARATPVESLFLSSITVLEIELGILLVERRDSAQGARLRQWLHQRILLPLLTVSCQWTCLLLSAVPRCMFPTHKPNEMP